MQDQKNFKAQKGQKHGEGSGAIHARTILYLININKYQILYTKVVNGKSQTWVWSLPFTTFMIPSGGGIYVSYFVFIVNYPRGEGTL